MVTTSYPRRPGDHAGWFVGNLARSLCECPDVSVEVLAPHELHLPFQEDAGPLRVTRLPYFWPLRYQRLAYGAGILYNLRHSHAAKLGVVPMMTAFLLALLQRRGQMDVVHAHWGVLGAIAILARPLTRAPVVLSVLGSDLKTTNKLIAGMTRWAIKRADAVLAESTTFVDEINRLRGKGDCVLMQNGVDLPDLARVQAVRGGFAARLVSVGRLIPERRHDLLVAAIAGLRRGAFPQATLTLVGDGPSRAALEFQAKELGLAGAVTFTGNVPTREVGEHLSRADLYVSPTMIESFGNAVMEAAAAALPVVTTAVGFPAELIVDGRCGHVVAPGDGAALAEAIARVLSLPDGGRTMGLEARRRLEELELTWPRNAQRTLAVYGSTSVTATS